MYTCTQVITMVTGEPVHPSPNFKITSAHSLKKEGVVGGQEYYPCCITKMAVSPSNTYHQNTFLTTVHIRDGGMWQLESGQDRDCKAGDNFYKE